VSPRGKHRNDAQMSLALGILSHIPASLTVACQLFTASPPAVGWHPHFGEEDYVFLQNTRQAQRQGNDLAYCGEFSSINADAVWAAWTTAPPEPPTPPAQVEYPEGGIIAIGDRPPASPDQAFEEMDSAIMPPPVTLAEPLPLPRPRPGCKEYDTIKQCRLAERTGCPWDVGPDRACRTMYSRDPDDVAGAVITEICDASGCRNPSPEEIADLKERVLRDNQTWGEQLPMRRAEMPLPRSRSETDASTCEYDARHRELLSDDPQTQKYLLLLPACVKLVEKDCPTAACAWAAGMEQAGAAVERRLVRGLVDAEEREAIRAEMDAASRVECARRPFEGIFYSIKAMIFGDGYRCALMSPPWHDWY
jgi:hypothetical protein